MTKIAITGASGFIGQRVLKQLEKKEGVALRTLDRDKHNLLDQETLKDFVKGQDVIIHLAGVNRTTNYELIQTNTLGTLSILEAMVKYVPKARLVFASTFQVYLNQSLYGLSKKFAEELVKLYGLNHKLKSTILRLSNVYGPCGKPFYNSVVATLAHLIKQGEPLKINGDGSQERDYVYVEDVADAFVTSALSEQEEVTETLDICTDQSTSLNEIIETIREVSGKKVEVVYNEAAKDVPWPTKDKNFDKAKKFLGWEPKTTLKEGLSQIFK